MMLKGKVAIVTGGSRGIGRAIVLALAKEGVNVAFNYFKNDEQANDVLKEAEQFGVKGLSYKFDVRDLNATKIFVAKVREYFGTLDILVNNAGIIRDKALMMMEESDWQDVIDTDLTGYYHLARACIVGFLKQKSGAIINISSVSGVTGTARQVNYSAAKAGIIGLTKALAKEVGPYNIRVNAVAPGFIDTDMVQTLKPEHVELLKQLIPKGEFGTPKDVANVVLFLLSEAADYITGQVIRVDGGMSTT